MAEYIDREEIKKAIHCSGNELLFIGGKTFINFEIIQKAVLDTPIADVVPKSEYDRLEKLFNDMTQEAKGYLNRIYGIRADVAREIFAEIDKLIICCRVDEYSKEFGYIIRQNYNGAMLIRLLAELKKKYTEGELT